MRNKKWEDSLKKLRFYCRQAIIIFFDLNCLDNNKKRKEFFEKEIIFNSNVKLSKDA